MMLTAHNCQNEKVYSYMSLSQNLYGTSSWSKRFQLYFENYDFCEYVKFGAISWKNWYFVGNCLIKVRI